MGGDWAHTSRVVGQIPPPLCARSLHLLTAFLWCSVSSHTPKDMQSCDELSSGLEASIPALWQLAPGPRSKRSEAGGKYYYHLFFFCKNNHYCFWTENISMFFFLLKCIDLYNNSRVTIGHIHPSFRLRGFQQGLQQGCFVNPSLRSQGPKVAPTAENGA